MEEAITARLDALEALVVEIASNDWFVFTQAAVDAANSLSDAARKDLLRMLAIADARRLVDIEADRED